MEVIALGHGEPVEVADAALQEDADFIGYRIVDREPVALISALLEALEEREISRIPIVVGGIIRREAVSRLLELGVAGVFGPGSRIADIADFVHAQKEAGGLRTLP
jgi:methylmalonyl-CoA mutase C-terminal domain/subunit